MNIAKKIFIVHFVFISACSYKQQAPLEETQIAIIKSDYKVETKALNKPATLLLEQKKEVKRARAKESPVILKLLADSEENIKQGKLNVAIATLERALRISPRDAGVVNKLAFIRFKQKKWTLAENLAKKSALLAQDNTALKKKNWVLISNIRQQKGDDEGADYAMLKAKQYN
jgi:hypothetical protein